MPGVNGPPWSEEESAAMHRLARSGLGPEAIAIRLGRPLSSVRNRFYRIGMRTRVLEATRERIVEFAAEGWKTSRIAMQVGVPIDKVERVLARGRA